MKSVLVTVMVLIGWAALAATLASPNYTTVTAPSSSVISDGANTWGISPAACTATWAAPGSTSMVTKNNVADGSTCSVAELAYVGGVIWQQNTAGNWYSWSGAAWSAATTKSPLPPIWPQAVLTWTAPTVDNNGAPINVPLTYNVYRGSNATSLSKLTNVAATTYIDPAGSTTPVTYYYAVTAVQAGQEGPQSNVVSAVLLSPTIVPSAVTLTVAP